MTYFASLQLPTPVFIEVTGTVLAIQVGALTEEELRARLTDRYGVDV